MSELLVTTDLSAWVAKAPADKKNFREAVHIILTAISSSTELRTKMVMKGGLLMALRYDSSRFTKDADFSTRALYETGDEQALLAALDAQLVRANAQTHYDTLCGIQRAKMMPAGPDKTFPTLSLSVGYAARSHPRALQRLLAKQSPNVVEIDYSYNEAVLDVEVLQLSDGEPLQVYSLVNLMAEKFRALLQQAMRQRYRRQDVYDLSLLLAHVKNWTPAEKSSLLACLVASARARGIHAQVQSMRNPEIKVMAAKGYTDMLDEIEGPLPPFNDIYQSVQDFYESLPWVDDAP